MMTVINNDSQRPRPASNGMDYPIRINRYLALQKIATRRGADALIEDGHVLINGRRAKLGDVVNKGDKVTIAGDAPKKEYTYTVYYKPLGLVTNNPHPGERAINLEQFGEDIFAIGRLDKDSEGLIILTNDGRVTDALLDPKKRHEKEYRVVVNKKITNSLLRGLKEGIKIGNGEFTRPAKVRKVDDNTFDIILTEGKNRQIRRMCKALGFDVKSLVRFRILNILIGKLRPGENHKLEGKQLASFLGSLGIPI